jgi:hypothetical protein
LDGELVDQKFQKKKEEHVKRQFLQFTSN